MDIRPPLGFDHNARFVVNRSAASRIKYCAFTIIFGVLLHSAYVGLLSLMHKHSIFALLYFFGTIFLGLELFWALMMVVFAYRIELGPDQFTVIRYGNARSFSYNLVRNVFVKDGTQGSVVLQLVIEGCTNVYNDFNISLYDLGNLIIQRRAIAFPALARLLPLAPSPKRIVTTPRIIIFGGIAALLTALGPYLYRTIVHP